MAYLTSVNGPSTALSLTAQRFLHTSTLYLFAAGVAHRTDPSSRVFKPPVKVAALQARSGSVRLVSSDGYPVGEFVDPPAFRSAAVQGLSMQLSQADRMLEAHS